MTRPQYQILTVLISAQSYRQQADLARYAREGWRVVAKNGNSVTLERQVEQ